MTILERLSPNFNDRGGHSIDCIVIHDTECSTAKSALDWFESTASKVSAHYVVDRDGTVYRCVRDVDRAWHAGQSSLKGREDVNSFSLGVELVGFCTEPYPDAQIDTTVELCVELCRRYPAITVDRIVGHEEIAIPPGRKKDPGPHFPWQHFRARVQVGIDQAFA